jgi:NAD(P)-dependent dehydrogenase (short-subunit alcohol dehydrogenase family)
MNNAAGNFLARTEDLSMGAFQSVIGIVLMGTLHATMACGRRWLAAGRGGVVLNITTTYTVTGSAYVVPSAVAKAGVQALTRSLAVEWGNRGIRMNAIAPGPIPTEGAFSRLLPRPELEVAAKNRNPLGRFGTVEEFANLAAFLISDGAGYINGEVVTMDGGEWLQGAGEFTALGRELTAKEWEMMRPKPKNSKE